MLVQCRVCRKVRDNGRFRQPWPGELPLDVKYTYCPACARETLATLQRGEVPSCFSGRAAAEHAG
jgi:hypothetical protein